MCSTNNTLVKGNSLSLVNLVLSTDWTRMELQPLQTPERKELVQRYMEQFSKKLNDQQLECIVDAKQCENPLFLRSLLEELRMFGSFEVRSFILDVMANANTLRNSMPILVTICNHAPSQRSSTRSSIDWSLNSPSVLSTLHSFRVYCRSYGSHGVD